MNPYEKTAQKMKRQSEGPKRFSKAGSAISGVVGAASFTPILSRAAPFLSEYIPETLAIKGLSKISPKFGKFIQEAFDSGYDYDEVKDFIGQQINDSQEGQAKENRNIIEQESPELHQFLNNEIRNGRNPIEAAAIAQNDKRFSSIIKNLMKKYKTPWSNLIQSIFGSGEQALPQQKQMQQGIQQMQQPMQNQQQGQGLDPAITQILQQGNAILQKFKR